MSFSVVPVANILEGKKVLFVSHDCALYGATRSMIDVARSLKDRHKCKSLILFPYRGRAIEVAESLSLEYVVKFYPRLVKNCGQAGFGRSTILFYRALRSFVRVSKVIRSVGPDVIVVNSSTNYWMLIVARLLRFPVLFHVREFGKKDYNLCYIFPHFIMVRIFKLADALVFNSLVIQKHYAEEFGVTGSVIYNGIAARDIDTSKGNFRNSLEGEIVFGIVGAVRIEKGQLEALQAIWELSKSFPSIKFYIVGDGDLVPLRNFVSEHAMQDIVEFTGYIDDPGSYYQLMDVLIVNSISEAFGRVMIEAGAYGIAVVGRDAGSTPEIISDGETGLLFSTKEDLLVKLKSLVYNRTLLMKLKRNLHRHVQTNFTLERKADMLSKELSRLIMDKQN